MAFECLARQQACKFIVTQNSTCTAFKNRYGAAIVAGVFIADASYIDRYLIPQADTTIL